jgi:hypothetical protein
VASAAGALVTGTWGVTKSLLALGGITLTTTAGIAALGAAASPQAWRTFTGSLELLAMTVGELLIPVFDAMSLAIQKFTRWLDSWLHGGKKPEPPAATPAEEAARFEKRRVEAQESEWSTEWDEFLDRWMGQESGEIFNNLARHISFGFAGVAPRPGIAGMLLPQAAKEEDKLKRAAPDLPHAVELTFEEYARRLGTAGINAGAQTLENEQRLKQLKILTEHGDLLGKLVQNTEPLKAYKPPLF